MRILSISLIKAFEGGAKTPAERDALAAEIREEWKEIAPVMTKLPGVHLVHENHYSISLEVDNEGAFNKALPKNWFVTRNAPPVIRMARPAPQ